MAKPLKIFLGVVGVVLLLLVGGVLAATLLFDPNDHRDQITAEAEKSTGRKLELGQLDLKIFPWLAVGAENVKLGNAPGFGTEPFAEIGSLHVGVKLLPLLLDQKIEVSTLTVSGLRLRLAVDKDGKNNWDDLAKPKEEEKPKTEEAPGEAQAFKLEDLDIGGIEIEDSALSYNDAKAGKNYSVEKLRLKTGAVALGEPLDVDLGLSLTATAPAAEADIAVTSIVKWDLQAQKYALQDLVLKLKGKMGALALDTELQSAIELELGKRAALSGLKLDFSGQQGAMQLKGNYSGDLSFDLVQQLLAIPALQLQATASGEGIPGGKQELQLSGGVTFDVKQGALDFSKAQLAAAGLSISTHLKGSGLTGEAPKLSGPINIAQFNPRDLLARLGQTAPKTSDPEALKSASFSAQYAGGFKSASLSDVVLKLDQTTARGRVDVRDFGTQAIQFALNVDQLDVDRYSAPAEKGAAPAAEEKKGSSVNDIQIPAETLDALNAEGTLDVGTLKVKGLKLSNAQVRLAGGKGQIKKQQIAAKLYGGSVTLNHQFTPGKRPQYAAQTQLAALNATPFLQDFLGKDFLSGLGSLNFNINSGGMTVGDLRKGLNGDLGLKLENGAVKGFNLGQIIRKGKAMLAGQAAPAESESAKTDFSAISFTAQIINGILKSDALEAASPLFRLAGSGEINLVDETINYLAKPTIVESSQGEGGKGLDDLRGLMIPIKLTGSLFAPSYKLDLESALKQKALSKVNEKIEGLKEQEKDKLKQKLNDQINKFLRPKAPAPAPATPAPAPTPAPAQPEAAAPPSS